MDPRQLSDTQTLKAVTERDFAARDILLRVYKALKAKGYDPITQLVGYLMSGDPTYITSYDGARALICRIERDEIMEELARFYLSRMEL